MPEPSRLVLLEQLPILQPGSKVRFLGCVHEYRADIAQLILRSRYPATESDIPQANVRVNDILENLNHELLSVGAWLNVVGYVSAAALHEHAVESNINSSRGVQVTATMIWSAGAIRTDRYESAVRQYQRPLG